MNKTGPRLTDTAVLVASTLDVTADDIPTILVIRRDMEGRECLSVHCEDGIYLYSIYSDDKVICGQCFDIVDRHMTKSEMLKHAQEINS